MAVFCESVAAAAILTSCTTPGITAGSAPATTVTAAEAPLPTNAEPASYVAGLTSVSCAPAGNCTAVGYYADRSGHLQGLLLTQASGRWAAAEAPLPGNAGRLLRQLGPRPGAAADPDPGHCAGHARQQRNPGRSGQHRLGPPLQ